MEPKFRAGEQVVLANGPHKFLQGTFLRLNEDVKWASIEQPDGQIQSHPLEWVLAYEAPKSIAAEASHSSK